MTTWEEVRLYRGGHGTKWYGEQCALELSNLIAARKVACPPELLQSDQLEPVPFSDDHPSISRVIRSLVIGLNDALDDEARQVLKPYAARILGTAAGPKTEEARALLAADWLVRVYAPALLRLADLDEEARALEGLPRITDTATARAALPTLDDVREAAGVVKADAWDNGWDAVLAAWGAKAAAWNAAKVAAWAVAWDAIKEAAGEAARYAIGEAAEGVTGPVAWTATWVSAVDAVEDAATDAARIAAGNAAWGVSWAAVMAAAGKAARTAARDAAESGDQEAAKEAAEDAIRAALRPAIDALQASALELLDTMLEVDNID